MEEDIIRLILESFPFGHVSLIHRHHKKGDRSHFFIEADNERFVVQLTSSIHDTFKVKKDIEILQLLNQEGLPVPELIKSRFGEYFIPFEHELLFIYKYIEGNVATPSVEFFNKLGSLLAILHTIPLHKYPYQSLFTPRNLFPIIRYHLEQSNDAKAKEIIEEIDQFPSFDQLPEAILHSRLASDSILENEKGQLFLIDFNQAGIGPAIVDIGFVLTNIITTQVEGELFFNSEFALAFLKSYQSIRKLTDEEQHLLSFAVYFAVITQIENEELNTLMANQYQKLQFIKTVIPNLVKDIN